MSTWEFGALMATSFKVELAMGFHSGFHSGVPLWVPIWGSNLGFHYGFYSGVPLCGSPNQVRQIKLSKTQVKHFDCKCCVENNIFR